MLKKTLTIMIIAAVAAVTAACTGTPQLNSRRGQSVETAKQRQIAYPQAGREAIPALELNGKAAGNAADSYQQSFQSQTTP